MIKTFSLLQLYDVIAGVINVIAASALNIKPLFVWNVCCWISNLGKMNKYKNRKNNGRARILMKNLFRVKTEQNWRPINENIILQVDGLP